ncbi:TIGR02757 family protein [bacterium]|nr:TIGR02757 family protein [bacterium]
MTPSPEKKKYLDGLFYSIGQQYISSDPIQIVKKFDNPEDQEIAAIVVSSLAFGQVSQILKAGNMVLSLMENQPSEYVRNFNPSDALKIWKKFYYRMIRHSDMLRLLWVLKSIKIEHASIGQWVLEKYQEDDVHLGITWARCIQDMKIIDRNLWKWTRSKGIGFNHLLPDPGKSSACKRAHLLLRWMVRKDNVDFGIWSGLPKEKLLIPVDTHIQRIAYNIGLTDRRDLSAKTSLEVTSELKKLDPNDPVKYDFALCRLGILKMCPKKRNPIKCSTCPIFAICRL